jgi:hypothetical protein
MKLLVKSPPRMPLNEFHLNGTTLECNAKFLDPEDLINRQEIDEHGNKLRAHPDFIKFLVRCEGDKADEIITYNQAMERAH